MAENASYTLLTRYAVRASEVGEAIDLGHHNSLYIMLHRHVEGTAGNIVIQHAASLAQDSSASGPWKDLATLPLNGTGGVYTRVGDFLRYVRFTSNADVSGSPLVSLAIIGKSA